MVSYISDSETYAEFYITLFTVKKLDILKT